MDKKIIKNCLTERFLKEARGETATPGITKTKEVQKKSGTINKAGVKDIEKDVKNLDKANITTKSDPVKFNYDNKEELDYHNDMEILNGQEMIRYDRITPEFQKKAEEGITGSSRMGNRAGKDTGNVEAAFEASSDSFGKDLVKRIKASTKKRYDAGDDFTGLGDDVENKPNGKKVVKHSPRLMHTAIKENKERYSPYGSDKEYEFTSQQKGENPNPKPKNVKEEEINEYSSDHEMGKWVPPSEEHKALMDKVVKKSGDREEAERAKKRKEVNEMDEGSFTAWCKANGFKDGPSEACARKAMGGDKSAAIHKKATFYMNTVQPNGDTTKDLEENNNNNNKKPQIKESMKRLTFNKLFNGVGNALKMIPESYRTDNKVFEMTDGNESYKIRWEGTLTEGRAVVLMASDKTMISEDMARMKHLMGYKSQETLGTVKGSARVNENTVFNDIMNKSKMLIEGELGMGLGEKAAKGEWDKVTKKAPEATKHIEGSTSDDKGTKAPKAKTSTGEALDSAKKQAPEAKKHVQGGLSTGTSEIGMGLGGVKAPEGEWEDISMPQAAPHGNPSKTTYNPKPSTGEWEKISVPHASDAKKHISMKEGVELNGIVFKPIVFKVNVVKEGEKKKVVTEDDDNTNVERKFKKKVASGEKTQADYDEWIKNKGKFAEESVNEEEDFLIPKDKKEEPGTTFPKAQPEAPKMGKIVATPKGKTSK